MPTVLASSVLLTAFAAFPGTVSARSENPQPELLETLTTAQQQHRIPAVPLVPLDRGRPTHVSMRALPTAEQSVLQWRPGLQHSCSTGPAGVAAAVLSKIESTSRDAAVARRMFRPLNMAGTGFQPQARLPGAFRADGLMPIPYWQVTFAAFAGLDAPPQPMSRLLQALLNQGMIDGQQTISEATVDRMFASESSLFGRFRTDGIGQQLIMEKNLFVEPILLNRTETRRLSTREPEAYRAPFPTTDSRSPVYVWPNELPIAGEPARNVAVINAVGDWLENSPTPKLLQHASPGAIIPPTAAAWMAEHYRNIETQFVGYGTHYIQEDYPEATGRGIVDWYRRQFSGATMPMK